MQRSRWFEVKDVAAIAVLVAVYFAAARVGFMFALASEVTLVWPPSGIALAALLLGGVRLWPGILLGAFLANWSASEPPLVALSFGVGNTLEALCGVYLLRRVGFRRHLPRLADALPFVLLAAMSSTMVGATLGAATLVTSGLQPLSAFPELWRDWWIGDAVGVLTVAPALLSWSRRPGHRMSLRRAGEASALGAGLVLACAIAFLQPDPPKAQSYPLHYLVFPFLAWAALRFGSRGSSIVALATAILVALSVNLELGRFGPTRGEDALLLLQLFLAVVAVMGLLLGAAVNERNVAHEALAAAEAQQRLKASELADQDKRKDLFLARLAHELRNPLAPIAAAVRLLHDKKEDPAAVERLRQILDRQITHLLGLVEDLLDVARITSGKVKLQVRRLDLQQVLRSAAEMSASQLEAQGVELVWEIPEETIWVDADPVRLAQIVQNLLSNAVRHGGQGGHVWLNARVQGDRVVLVVRDDGAGMTADVLAHAFEPFAQGPGTGKNLGLGIGLTLVRELAQLHGGCVQADSEGPGKGAVFRVILPRRTEWSTTTTTGGAAATDGHESALARRVLVVDDNADAAEMLAALLEQRGHRVSVAHDGKHALERARVSHPDVMLLDIEMPIMNGYDVARAVREDPELQGMRLIAVSGHLEARDERRPREAGFDLHMVKPVDPEALYAALE